MILALVFLFAQSDRPVADGLLRNTKRYNVTFRESEIDLADFASAIRADAGAEEVDVLVRSLESRAIQERASFEAAVQKELGGRVVTHFWLINASTVEIEPEKVPALAKLPNVERVDPDYICEPLAMNLWIRDSTNATHHNADAEQARGNRARSVGVAIIDTGQDETDLLGLRNRPHRTYYRNGNGSDRSGGGILGSRLLVNRMMGSQSPDNRELHGTGVASVAAGANWGSYFADEGHASDAGIAGYSICDFLPGCNSNLSTEARAWQQVAADAVRYHIVAANMSYGSSPNPGDASQQAIDACALYADVLPVTAAGNSATNTSGSSSTANGLAVGSCDKFKRVSYFSAVGPLSGDPGRFFPDISAGGDDIVMAANDGEGGEWLADGTSFASPQVCGAAALVRAAAPQLSARETKAILLCSAEDISAQNPTLDRNHYGVGYLRDDRACDLARRTGSAFTESLTAVQQPRRWRLSARNGQRVSIAAVWYRHQLNNSAWSEIRMKVYDGARVIASSADPRNLYQVIRFNAPRDGNFDVELIAQRLSTNPLPVSLAADADWVPISTATVFVDCNARAPFLGTEANPFLRLGDALALPSPIQEIRLAPCWYRENLSIDRALTLISPGGDVILGD